MLKDSTTGSKGAHYTYAYCLIDSHNRLRQYICLEQKCIRNKYVCLGCLKEKHKNHSIIDGETLLKIMRRKIINKRMTVEIDKINYIIQRLQKQEGNSDILAKFEILNNILIELENYKYLERCSAYETSRQMEFACHFIAFSDYFRLIKEPHSLLLSESEIPFQTVSQIKTFLSFEMSRISQLISCPLRNIIFFRPMNEKIRKYNQKKYIQTIKNQQKQLKESQTQEKLLCYGMEQDSLIGFEIDMEERVNQAHEGEIYNLVDLGEGEGNEMRQFASLGSDGFVRFWSSDCLKCLHSLKIEEYENQEDSMKYDIQYLGWLKCLAVSCKTGISLVRVDNYKILRRIKTNSSNISSCEDLQLLLLVSDNERNVEIFDLQKCEVQFSGTLPKTLASDSEGNGNSLEMIETTHHQITTICSARRQNNFFCFIGEQDGSLTQYDLVSRNKILSKRISSSPIFYIASCRSQTAGEQIVLFSSHHQSQQCSVKLIAIDSLEVLVKLNFPSFRFSSCSRNLAFIILSNHSLLQIHVHNDKLHPSIINKFFSTFTTKTKAFYSSFIFLNNSKCVIYAEYSPLVKYTNLIKFPLKN